MKDPDPRGSTPERETARPHGERLYSALLSAFPERTLEEPGFRDEMLDGYRHLRNSELRRGGLFAGLKLWTAVGRDIAVAAWREHRDPLDQRGRRPGRMDKGGDGMRGYLDDLVYAARRLKRSPAFAITALAILGLGIGVNVTAFSIVNALLLQPPPFADPDNVVLVLQGDDGGNPSSTSYPAYEDMREYSVFESVSSFYIDQAFLGRPGETLSPILIEYASASYLDVVGLTPSRGAWFENAHDDPLGAPAAVVTHRMWSDRLGSDPGVLGSVITVNGGDVTVIGVGPVEFNGGRGPGAVDLWLSISALRSTGGRFASLQRRQDHPFAVRARLAPGVSLDAATVAMDALAAELAETYPTLNEGRGISVLSVQNTRVSPEVDAQLVPAAAFGMTVVVLVLLIGTLNLANLLLVRSTARAREIAVRLALGASRARVIRVVLAEAVLLAVLGGVSGYLIAVWGAGALRRTRFDFVVQLMMDIRLDWKVAMFAATLSVAAGLVFGLIPALRATGRDVNATLRNDASARLGAQRRFGLTGSLVAGQVAASLLLVALAGVFVQSLGRAQAADVGFNWEETAYAQVNISPLGLEGEAATGAMDRLEERLEALPMITAVSRSMMLPAAQFGTTTLLLGAAIDGTDRPVEIPWNVVSPDFFSLLDIPLLDGRLLTDLDAEGARVAVVSESFAMTYFGRPDVVGEVYRSEGDPETPVEIVGVVGDAVVRALGESPTPSLYWPLIFSSSRMNLVFRYEGESAEALGAAQAAIKEVDSRIMVLRTQSMEDHLGATLVQQRLTGIVLSALGVLALVLAMIGVYGVVSVAVSQRRREVGIRIALGAASESVIGLFVRDIAAVVIVGAVIGCALAIPAASAAGRMFTGTPGTSLLAVGASGLLLLSSLLATVVPAARATSTDPTEALREE